MTKNAFKESFKRGLGRALIELNNTDTTEKYKEIVLWGCLHDTCYDAQCEDGRGRYLYEAINCYTDKSYFEEAIIRKYRNNIKNTWLFDQLTDLLVRFAIDGSMTSKEVLYKKYDDLFKMLTNKRKFEPVCNERDEFEALCVNLTSLDGFRAFKKIVEEVADYYIRTGNERAFSMDWFYSNAQNKFGSKRIENYIRRQPKQFNAFKQYSCYAIDEEYRSERERMSSKNLLEEFIKICYESSSYSGVGSALKLARKGEIEDLKILAQLAVEEKDLVIKEKLLRPFTKVKFPLEEKYVWDMLENESEAIHTIAYSMIEYFKSDKVHQFAIEQLQKEENVEDALLLLCKCYKPTDERTLVSRVKALRVSYLDEDNWHNIFMKVEALIAKNRKMNPDLLFYLYKKTLCSFCREQIIRTMNKRKVLTKEIIEECEFDSSEKIRKFAYRELKKLQLVK